MKKIAIFLVIVLIIVSIVYYMYADHMSNVRKAEYENFKFEMYLNKEIQGLDLTTIINKAIDSNEKNNVEKEKTGKYKDNNMNSINIDIKFIDNDETYNIEKIYNFGLDKFLSNYRTILFKCTDVQYHSYTKKIKYMKFEQTSK